MRKGATERLFVLSIIPNHYLRYPCIEKLRKSVYYIAFNTLYMLENKNMPNNPLCLSASTHENVVLYLSCVFVARTEAWWPNSMTWSANYTTSQNRLGTYHCTYLEGFVNQLQRHRRRFAPLETVGDGLGVVRMDWTKIQDSGECRLPQIGNCSTPHMGWITESPRQVWCMK